jgi:hypothetical protein
MQQLVHASTTRPLSWFKTKESDTVITVLKFLPLPTGRSIPLIPDLPVSFSGTTL